MRFEKYINEAKKLKGTMIGFGVNPSKLEEIYDYIENFLIRYNIDYTKQKNPHFSIAMIPGKYKKDELVREINKISKDIVFNPKGLSLFRGKNVKKDFITAEYKPNKYFIGVFKEISSKFETMKFEEIRPHTSLFIVEQNSITDVFFKDMEYNIPKLPKLKPSAIELWNVKYEREYIKK